MSHQEPLGRAGYIRPQQGRLLAGVCAGLARRWGIAPWLVRLIFLALALLPGSVLVLYVPLWVLMPPESATWRLEPPRG